MKNSKNWKNTKNIENIGQGKEAGKSHRYPNPNTLKTRKMATINPFYYYCTSTPLGLSLNVPLLAHTTKFRFVLYYLYDHQ